MMSMCAYMKEIKPSLLQELLDDPEAVEDFIGSGGFDDDGDEEAESEAGAGAGEQLDLHKSWQALHFVLTGTPWEVDDRIPVSQAVLGGEEIGEDFTGYGPARFLGPDRVKEVSAGMGLLQIKDLIEKYSAEDYERADLYAFNGIDEERGDISRCFSDLKSFYQGCASRGSAVIIWIE
ncbi:MAG: YfbM family protein [Cyanobacteria bacterium]|nr:YfbM family protein [Cyanobacteriota bacterium]